MMNCSNEDKKSYVCWGREGGSGGGGEGLGGMLGPRLLALCVTFMPYRNRTFISSTREGSNVGLEILQLSSGECIVPSPTARSYYHPETSV